MANNPIFFKGVSHTTKVQIQLSFPLELLAELVTAADTKGVTVADYLTEALQEKLSS
jgi:hypothetical protein